MTSPTLYRSVACGEASETVGGLLPAAIVVDQFVVDGTLLLTRNVTVQFKGVNLVITAFIKVT